MCRYRPIATAFLIASLLASTAGASSPEDWPDTPPRNDVKEVKFHSGYTAKLKEIEEEACRHYSLTGEFKIFQEKSNPESNDVRSVNFGYSCVHPDNPEGGWLYLPSIASEIQVLAGATEEADVDGLNKPTAGQVLADEVWHGASFTAYPRKIFPDYLPDDSTPSRQLWTFNNRKPNPKRMALQVFRGGDLECPPGLTLGTLSSGQKACYQDTTTGALVTELAWHDHTVFEKYPHKVTSEKFYPENTPVLVNPPESFKPDTWKYEQ